MHQLIKPKIHHLGVQTADLDNCLAWYQEFLGAEKKWEIDRFSDLTLNRLPGIGRLIEIVVGDMRLHLFDRADHSRNQADENGYLFQHVCIQVDMPDNLIAKRRQWIDLYKSGHYKFVRPDLPTEIVVDDNGVQSFYFYDVNGLEYELAYIPDGR
ncbi:VOC family protein [Streptosporangium sp. NBC_01469]|uniref:VOC family protein n=1 Tax=Streptosporangium sp. NBC_01469 TaxID=2903898 RepID=UPI002E2CEC4A|nr:VOC family protein [Streptosporangium sp. NBC_01469]